MGKAIKKFIKPHPDYGIENLEDRLGINTSATRMVVADGMTLSYLSGLFAEAIINKFLNESVPIDTLKDGSAFTSSDVVETWSKQVEQIEAKYEGTDAGWLLQNRKKNTPHGDCTLAGIDMSQQGCVTAIAIGDCCIFFLSGDGKLLKTIPNIEVGQFNNAPDYISSTGNIYGRIYTEQVPIVTGGYIVLMSDAVAEWFLKNLDKKPSSLEQIWQLKDQKEMNVFFDAEYHNHRIKGDDIAIIIIKTDGKQVAQTKALRSRHKHLFKKKNRNVLKFGTPKTRDRKMLNKKKRIKR